MTFKVIAYDNRVTRITFEKPSLSREEVMFNDYDAAKRFVNSLKDDWVYRSYRFHIVYVYEELIPPASRIELPTALDYP